MGKDNLSAIRAHLSGYSSLQRREKFLGFLQVFIDDSVSGKHGDRRLFFAGYLNRSENWETFSDAWREVLSVAPPIDYFKMSEARALQGQFRGLSREDRDKKLSDLTDVIRHFKPISFDFSVSDAAFRDYVKKNAPHGLADPRLAAAFSVINGVIVAMSERGNTLPIDFIFDEMNGVDFDVHVLFELLKSSLSVGQRKQLYSPPIFRNDTDFLPLQAADMLAWHVRRQHEKGDVIDALKHLKPVAHLSGSMEDKDIIRFGKDIQKIPNIENFILKKEWKSVLRQMQLAKNIKKHNPIFYFFFNSFHKLALETKILLRKLKGKM